MAKLITYKIVTDVDNRLKAAARTACNFWNRFVKPKSSIVIRLETFTSVGATIARSHKTYSKSGVVYGVVEFNTKFLREFSTTRVAGTIAHEIGHTLGYGWAKWLSLFDQETGRFKPKPIAAVPALAKMLVETDYGPGTSLYHWDEKKFGAELMTGIDNKAEHVLPVTIDVASLLGHKVLEQLKKKTPLKILLSDAMNLEFSRQKEAKALDLDHFEATSIWEENYDFGRRKRPLA